jgi:hypothetical protein
LQLARVDGERHAPPICKFEWGGDVVEGVIESVRRQFVLFDPNGTPTRITMSIGVKRYRSLKEQLGAMNRRSPDRTRTVVVVAGDTLPAIAFRAMGTAPCGDRSPSRTRSAIQRASRRGRYSSSPKSRWRSDHGEGSGRRCGRGGDGCPRAR